MNRAALGLAVGAGYVLGRTKKMKLAFAVGTMVAGKRLHLSPRALAELVSTQLQNNPQFKEIGDQLRQDLRGVGQAATGALVERQIEGLAGRLHDRTAGVRDQIAGVAPDPDDVRDAGKTVTGVVTGRRDSDEDDERDDRDERDEQSDSGDDAGRRRPAARSAGRSRGADEPRSGRPSGAARKPAAKKTAAKTATKKSAAKKTTRTATNAAKGGRGRG